MQPKQEFDLLRHVGLVYSMMPDKHFVGARMIHDNNSNYFTFEVLVNSDESYFARIPTTQDTLPKLEACITTTKILNQIAEKNILPFRIPRFIMEKPVATNDGTVLKIVIMEPFWGNAVAVKTLTDEQVKNVAHVLANIHSLDLKIVENAGFPSSTNVQIRNNVKTVLSKASHTGKIPVNLLEKWNNFVNDDEAWDFKSSVIHGHMMPHQILFQGEEITYVQGWHSLQISDPAYDLAAIVPGLDIDKSKIFFDVYYRTISRKKNQTVTDLRADNYIERRAEFYTHFEIVKNFLLALDHNDRALEAELLDDMMSLNEKLELRQALDEEELKASQIQKKKEEMLKQRELQDSLPTQALSAKELGINTSENSQIGGFGTGQTNVQNNTNQDLQATEVFDEAPYTEDSELDNLSIDDSSSLGSLARGVQNNENPAHTNIELSKYITNTSEEE